MPPRQQFLLAFGDKHVLPLEKARLKQTINLCFSEFPLWRIVPWNSAGQWVLLQKCNMACFPNCRVFRTMKMVPIRGINRFGGKGSPYQP